MAPLPQVAPDTTIAVGQGLGELAVEVRSLAIYDQLIA